MAIDLCSVTETLRCNPAPDKEMFKVLVLRALLAISSGTMTLSSSQKNSVPKEIPKEV